MKNTPKHAKKTMFPLWLRWMIAGILAVVLILAAVFAILSMDTPREEEPPVTSTEPESESESEEPVVESETEPMESESESQEPETESETEPVILPELAELYAENSDLCGWISIQGTDVDYPVMFTPDDEEKYLRKNFKGKYDIAGLPFLDADCSLDPESDNLIVYGHNLQDGRMFQQLLKYKKKSYWEEHPVITFKTLYEERTYEVLSAFYDRIYYKYETGFKFYQFIDADDETEFQTAMDYYAKKAEYDTGVKAQYGDSLLTLVTCSYHHEYGRFVVVAREKSESFAMR